MMHRYARWYLCEWFSNINMLYEYMLTVIITHWTGIILVIGMPSIILNIGWYTGISAEISVFYSKRYDKCKNLLDIILDRYWPNIATWSIYRPIFEMKYWYIARYSYLFGYLLFFCLRDHFISFYVHCGISVMFLHDVWIITYFF